MIDAYIWTTGNGRKVVVACEEMGLAYRLHPVNIRRGDQFKPEFLRISPNNKIPAITDDDGPGGGSLAIFESAAILMYLAEKSGRLLPAETAARYEVLQWLVFSVTALGPIIGQVHYFQGIAREGNEHALERFRREIQRVFKVMEERLAESEWLGGDGYSIADISTYCRARGWKRLGIESAEVPHLRDWLARIDARPAVRRADGAIEEMRRANETPMDEEARRIMYGDRQLARR
jgi:GST-like protein